MKNCSICVKKDVCNHRINIITNFGRIVEIRFGALYSETQEYKDLISVVGKYCRYYLNKG